METDFTTILAGQIALGIRLVKPDAVLILALPVRKNRELHLRVYELKSANRPIYIGQMNWPEKADWQDGVGGLNARMIPDEYMLGWLNGHSSLNKWRALETLMIPLSVCGFHLAFAFIGGRERLPEKEIHHIVPLLALSFLCRGLSERFTIQSLQEVDPVHRLAGFFFEELCQLLLPALCKSPDALLWTPYAQELYPPQIETGDYQINLGSMPVYLRTQIAPEWQIGLFAENIEHCYRQIFQTWELCHRKDQLFANKMQLLIRSAESDRQLLQQWLEKSTLRHQEIVDMKRIAEQLVSPGGHSEFEFFRGTQSWNLRFEGEMIKMEKGGNVLGLIYMHQLMMRPQKEIHCRQLYLRSPKDVEKAFPITQEFSELKGKKLFPTDEQGLVKSIKCIEDSLADADPEVVLELQEYILAVAEQLYHINPSRTNFDRLIHYRDHLKKNRLVLSSDQENTTFYESVRILKGVLRRYSEKDKEAQKIYQNVTKAIKRSIGTMSHQKAKAFFTKTITLGSLCCYDPEKADIPAPSWRFWME
ncbi:MAG: hypothetical protein SH848_19395 [Saprospiraceae bacterium]|nr:hypothetical protein [Saprospiraceae bacterium]